MAQNHNLQSGDSSSATKILEAVQLLTEALSGLSNKQCREALSMVAAPKNLRVISMDRPVGNNQPTVNRPIGRKPKATPAAAWKQRPEWISAVADHATAIAAVKSASTEADRSQRVRSLREIEDHMRALKLSLQGKQTL